MKKTVLLTAILLASLGVNAQTMHKNASDSTLHPQQANNSMMTQHAWSRVTAPNTPGAIFIDIKNDTNKDDVLIAASTPVATQVELHGHIDVNGVMQMREMKDGIPLGKSQTTTLKPGGYHIMLMNLKEPLKKGQKFPLTLKFKNALSRTVIVTVDNGKADVDMGSAHH